MSNAFKAYNNSSALIIAKSIGLSKNGNLIKFPTPKDLKIIY